jgi:hypothetical protein
VLGVRDLDWESMGCEAITYQDMVGAGMVDLFAQSTGFSYEDIASIQMHADFNSLFNNKIYVEFKAPNRFAIRGRMDTDLGKGFRKFTVLLLIKHADSLTTIPPTKMEIFERLATADVANYLYNNLKYYDGLQTVYANIELKLDDIKQKADERDNIIQEIKDSYVSASNDYSPMILCV